MASHELTCDACHRRYSLGYMVKQIDVATRETRDVCIWCSTLVPGEAFEETGEPHDADVEGGLPGMSEGDYGD